MLHADKEVTNSQWCHSQKCESACLQLLSTLINSGPGLFDGNRTAKQGRFMKSVSVAPVYFIFKPLCFGGNTSSPSFAHLRDFKGQFFFFFHTVVRGIRLYAHCSPAPGRAQRMEASPTFVTLLPCHASPTRAPSLLIALQAHRTWTRQRGKRRGEREKKKG